MKRKKKKEEEDGTVLCYPDILLVVLYCCVATSLNLLGRLARYSFVARNIEMHLTTRSPNLFFVRV